MNQKEDLIQVIEKAMDMMEKFADENHIEIQGLITFTFSDLTVHIEQLYFDPNEEE